MTDNRQRVSIIDVTRSLLPGDPNMVTENISNTQSEDAPEETIPAVPLDGHNILPTAYGYRSYFGVSSVHALTALSGFVSRIFLHQTDSYQNTLYALTATGVWRSKPDNTWEQVVTLTDPGTGINKAWTICVIQNIVYMYRQGEPTYWTISFAGVVETKTPTFLNMAGQMGLFRAGGRLAFFDSANSIAWSSLFDHTNFTPSTKDLIGNTLFKDILGRIVTAVPLEDGFVIYATRSIVYVRQRLEGTIIWEGTALTNSAGIIIPENVVSGADDSLHYAYTEVGIYEIKTPAFGVAEPMKPILQAFFDYMRELDTPVYLDFIQNRYLLFSVLDPNYVDSTALVERTQITGYTTVLFVGRNGAEWNGDITVLPITVDGNVLATAMRHWLTKTDRDPDLVSELRYDVAYPELDDRYRNRQRRHHFSSGVGEAVTAVFDDMDEVFPESPVDVAANYSKLNPYSVTYPTGIPAGTIPAAGLKWGRTRTITDTRMVYIGEYAWQLNIDGFGDPIPGSYAWKYREDPDDAWHWELDEEESIGDDGFFAHEQFNGDVESIVSTVCDMWENFEKRQKKIIETIVQAPVEVDQEDRWNLLGVAVVCAKAEGVGVDVALSATGHTSTDLYYSLTVDDPNATPARQFQYTLVNSPYALSLSAGGDVNLRILTAGAEVSVSYPQAVGSAYAYAEGFLSDKYILIAYSDGAVDKHIIQVYDKSSVVVTTGYPVFVFNNNNKNILPLADNGGSYLIYFTECGYITSSAPSVIVPIPRLRSIHSQFYTSSGKVLVVGIHDISNPFFSYAVVNHYSELVNDSVWTDLSVTGTYGKAIGIYDDYLYYVVENLQSLVRVDITGDSAPDIVDMRIFPLWNRHTFTLDGHQGYLGMWRRYADTTDSGRDNMLVLPFTKELPSSVSLDTVVSITVIPSDPIWDGIAEALTVNVEIDESSGLASLVVSLDSTEVTDTIPSNDVLYSGTLTVSIEVSTDEPPIIVELPINLAFTSVYTVLNDIIPFTIVDGKLYAILRIRDNTTDLVHSSILHIGIGQTPVGNMITGEGRYRLFLRNNKVILRKYFNKLAKIIQGEDYRVMYQTGNFGYSDLVITKKAVDKFERELYTKGDWSYTQGLVADPVPDFDEDIDLIIPTEIASLDSHRFLMTEPDEMGRVHVSAFPYNGSVGMFGENNTALEPLGVTPRTPPITLPGFTITGSNFVYEDVSVTYPGASFVINAGTPAPYNPTKYGAWVMDTRLNKWGKLNAEYKLIVPYSPINDTSKGSVPYTNFGMEAGVLLTTGKLAIFSAQPAESYITYGKLGYYRRGQTLAVEARAQFRAPANGEIIVRASLDGRVIETSVTQTFPFTAALDTNPMFSISGKWHTVTVSGNFDLNFLEFRGILNSRR